MYHDTFELTPVKVQKCKIFAGNNNKTEQNRTNKQTNKQTNKKEKNQNKTKETQKGQHFQRSLHFVLHLVQGSTSSRFSLDSENFGEALVRLSSTSADSVIHTYTCTSIDIDHFQSMRAANSDFASLSVLNTVYNHCLPRASTVNGQLGI